MSDRRTLLAVVGAVVVVIALVAAGAFAVWGLRRNADEAPRATLARAQPIVSSPPRALRDGEAYVRTKVLSSGDVLVTHWIQSSALLFTVVLTPPGIATGVSAEDVEVMADGQVIPGVSRIAAQPARYRFIGSSTVQISYRLAGAVERSRSMPDRAFARWTALDVSYEVPTHRVTRTILGPRVLSLACSTPPAPASASVLPGPRPCGTRVSAGEWTVDLQGPLIDDLVVAAVNLRRGPTLIDAQGVPPRP